MRLHKRHLVRSIMYVLCSATTALAQESADPVSNLVEKGYSVHSVTPIFSQLVALKYPGNFRPASENATPTYYSQEAVPNGENVDEWSQMITVTGARGEALPSQATASTFLQAVAEGFRRLCPTSFVAKALGKTDVGGYEGVAALMGCGANASGRPRSEVAFIISVKGSSDIYTIQWAERGEPLEGSPTFDDVKWRARYQQLLPIRICDRVANEPPPYKSCLERQ